MKCHKFSLYLAKQVWDKKFGIKTVSNLYILLVKLYVAPQNANTVKALLSPQCVYLIMDAPEGGLIERGLIRERGLFTKSDDKDIFDSFSGVAPHILRNQHTILRVSRHSFLPNHIKIDMQACFAR